LHLDIHFLPSNWLYFRIQLLKGIVSIRKFIQ